MTTARHFYTGILVWVYYAWRMDVSIINPFLTATLNLFETMFRITATPGKPYVMERELGHRWEISGILGVTGDYHGVVAVRLSRVLADKMLERSGIATSSEGEREDTLYGMIGEMVNIIAGNASSVIKRPLEISPPVVVYGQNHNIAWPRTIPVVAIPFTTTIGPFEVAVCFKIKDFF